MWSTLFFTLTRPCNHVLFSITGCGLGVREREYNKEKGREVRRMNKDMELTEACGKPKLGTLMMQDRTSNGRSSVSVTSISCVEGIIQHWYFLYTKSGSFLPTKSARVIFLQVLCTCSMQGENETNLPPDNCKIEV